jgi:hypothetical protein
MGGRKALRRELGYQAKITRLCAENLWSECRLERIFAVFTISQHLAFQMPQP